MATGTPSPLWHDRYPYEHNVDNVCTLRNCPRCATTDRIAALAGLEFIDREQVIHFLSPLGTGKIHLVTALGVNEIKAGKSVYRAKLTDLVDTLARK